MTVFRLAGTDDIDTLVELRLACERAEHERISSMTEASLVERYRDFLTRRLSDDFYVFVACNDTGQIVATASLLLEERPMSLHWLSNIHASVLHVYTIPEYRRQGLALKLCELVIDKARQSGASLVELDATEAGQPVYRKLGFSVKDNGCLVMRLNLLASGD